MSTGRYIMRGRVFQGLVFATRALADSWVAPPVGTVNDGWTFEREQAVWTFEREQAVWTFEPAETVFTFGD